MGRVAVQSAGRFIRQNQFGLVDDCPSASTPLFLTAGHLVGVFVQNIRDVQFYGHSPHPTVNLARGNLIDGQCQGNVFTDGQSIQQIKILKHESEIFPAKPGNLFFIDLGYIGSIQIDMSRADCINGGNAVE